MLPASSPHGRSATMLLLGIGMTGSVFAFSQFPGFDVTAAPPAPEAPVPEPLSTLAAGQPELKQMVVELEKELERLDAASRRIATQATELLGPPNDSGERTLKLPQEQAELVKYLKRCLDLVENVEHSFGDLVVAKGQVDLQERIPEAREHVQRLEKIGAAGMLARRQVRAWIEKDLQAVESLNADWPAMRKSIQEMIQATKQFDAGDLPAEKIAANHQAVLECTVTRTRFRHSRLGLLCRQTADAADQLHRQRKAEPAVVMKLSSAAGFTWLRFGR